MRTILAVVPLVLVGAYALHARAERAEQEPVDSPAPTTADRSMDFRSDAVRIRGGATATISISLDGSLDILREELESWDGESELDLEHLSLSGDLLAQLAASLDAYLEIETDEGRRVLVAQLRGGERELH